MKKQYNPYAYNQGNVLEWGFLDPDGKLVTQDPRETEEIEHADLATQKLGMEVHEALEQGYTRLLVERVKDDGKRPSHGDLDAPTRITAYFVFNAYTVSPVEAIEKYLKHTQIPIDRVLIEASDYGMEDTLDGYEGRVCKGMYEWLRHYDPPREENPWRTRNGTYQHDKRALDWGFIGPDGVVHSGVAIEGVTDHANMAEKLWKKNFGDLMLAGYVRYGVLRDGEGIFSIRGSTDAEILAALKVLLRYMKESPELSGEVNLDIYRGDFSNVLLDSRYSYLEDAIRAVRAMSRLKPGSLHLLKSYAEVEDDREPRLEGRYQDENGDVEEEENPMWGYKAFTGQPVEPPIEWGWMRPNGSLIKGGYGGWHDDLARRKKLGRNWVEAVASGNVKYEIKQNGDLLVEGVKSHQAARNIIKLAERPEVREVALTWVRGSDGATMEYGKSEVGVIIQRLRGVVDVGKEENPRAKKNDWHTFTLDQYEQSHPSYDDASFWAQCTHDTKERPKRLAPGLYQLKRTYIGTTQAIKDHGFEFEPKEEYQERMREEKPRRTRNGTYHEEENPLTMSPNGAAWARDNKAQVLVEMDPRDFLVLTTNSKDHARQISDEARTLEAYNAHIAVNYTIPPFLMVDLNVRGEGWAGVVSHEGRHRAAAVINNGEYTMPVYLRLREDDSDPYALSWKDLPDTIYGQFGVGHINRRGPGGTRPPVSTSRFRVLEPDLLARFRRENPYIHDRGHILEWGFLDPNGKLITQDQKESEEGEVIDHVDLAADKLNMDVGEAMKAGYTRVIVELSGSEAQDRITAYIEFDAATVLPPKAIARYLKDTPIHVTRVIIEVKGHSKMAVPRRYNGPPNAGLFRWLRTWPKAAEENPAPRRPGEKDRRWPFKLVQKDESTLIAEMRDLSRYTVTKADAGYWLWAPINTGQWSESFETLEGALLNLEIEAESHTGRLGGTMKFVIYSPTGFILGTVMAPNRRAARDVLRGHIDKLRFKTAQDGLLQPYISSSPEVKYVADQGVQIK